MNHSFPSKLRRFLALILTLVLVVGLMGCGKEDAPAGESVKGTVSADDLNVRSSHSTDSTALSQLPIGLEIEILDLKAADDTIWGRIDDMTLPDGTKIKGGWINLKYVDLAGDTASEPTDPTGSTETEPPTEPPVVVDVTMGTITAGELNIRKGPNSDYESVGTYLNGDRIEILETQSTEDGIWGRTSKGWINMSYVRMDGTLPTVSSEDDNATVPNVISDGTYNVLGYGVVDLASLNVRSGPATDFDKVTTVTYGTRYAYYQVSGDWVRIEDGWVSTEYFYIEGTTSESAITVTVTVEELNIRSGPGTSFKSVGAFKQNETVKILAQINNWGYTDKGWISMNNVEQTEPTYEPGAASIKIGLNIRKEPNADAEIVGSYTEGQLVTILEVQGTWGKTDKGWINLNYVEFS